MRVRRPLRSELLPFLLTLDGALIAAAGILYWKVATHFYEPDVIGAYSAFLASAAIAQNLGSMGLTFGLNMYMPPLKAPSTGGFVNALLVVNLSGLTVAALTVHAVLSVTAGPGQPGTTVFFVGFVAASGLNSFINSILALTEAPVGLLSKNALANAVRISALPLVIPFGVIGMLYSNLAAFALGITAAMLVLFPRIFQSSKPRIRFGGLRSVVTYSLQHGAVGYLWSLPPQLVIMFSAQSWGTATTAFFSTAWLYASAVNIVSSALAVKGVILARATSRGEFAPVLRRLVLQTLALVSVISLAAIASRTYVLGLFGSDYSARSSEFALILLLGAIPFSINTILTQVLRLYMMDKEIWMASGIVLGSTLILLLTLSGPVGESAAAWSWSIGQTTCFFYLGIAAWRKRQRL